MNDCYCQIKGHNSSMKKGRYFEIELGLPYMILTFVYKFQMICLRGTYVIDRKREKSVFFGKSIPMVKLVNSKNHARSLILCINLK